MRFLPAVDILDGQAVRLLQGDYAAVTVFGDAEAVVGRLLAQGAKALHLVDLNAARDPKDRSNRQIIDRCLSQAREYKVMVELGGGVRDKRAVSELFALGVDRVIIGTSALETKGWVLDLEEEWRPKLVLSLDFRMHDGEAFVVMDAWRRTSAFRLEEAVDDFSQQGFITQLITPVSRDGMASGPDLERYRQLVVDYPIDLIASGGIRDARDLEALASIAPARGRIEGAIVGTALYRGALSVPEGLIACSR
ncbi:1-(5-phosphoribosyl)-5-[(5-phosphoribosylamino)methylideneamino] imidazole-4-carboxamide isomerase [Ferrimicrobium sp.]|uniref:1-(5-phosphoribosyl)-5-[(5- phosphoribosylamino)methylideneamino]imidazole-4- carboxamide isomerase n=1 Tax=Ferrimicrobium sp. TaxID=2926050 RepID=UPI002605F7AE|nr:1-(5-phosphoribosyl)-5-[(5-phosphoribosylamino)methylideneamino] imidazole-4-carboxamide isomerase [Ferrimicrobium sp.]